MSIFRRLHLFLIYIFLINIFNIYSEDSYKNQFLAPQTQIYNLSLFEYVQSKISSLSSLSRNSLSLLQGIWKNIIKGNSAQFPIKNYKLESSKPDNIQQNQWDSFISLINRLNPNAVNEQKLNELTSILKNYKQDNNYEPSNVYYFDNATYQAFVSAYEGVTGTINQDIKNGIAGILPSGMIIFNETKFNEACQNEYKAFIDANAQVESGTVKDWLKVAIIYGHEYGHLLYENGTDEKMAESIADEAFIKRLFMYSGMLTLTDGQGNFLINEKQEAYKALMNKIDENPALRKDSLSLEDKVNIYFSDKVPSILKYVTGQNSYAENIVPLAGLAEGLKASLEDIVAQFNTLFKFMQNLEKQRFNPKILDDNTLRFFNVGISNLLEPEEGSSFTDLVSTLLKEKHKEEQVIEIYNDIFNKFSHVCAMFINPMVDKDKKGLPYSLDEVKSKQFINQISKLTDSLSVVATQSNDADLKALLTRFQGYNKYLSDKISSVTRQKETQELMEKHPGLFENLKKNIPSQAGDYSATMSYASDGAQVQSHGFLPHTNYKITNFMYAGHLRIAKAVDKNGQEFNILLVDNGSDKKYNKSTKTGGFTGVESSFVEKMAPILSLKGINISEVWFFSGCELREQTLPFDFKNYLQAKSDSKIGLLGKYSVKSNNKENVVQINSKQKSETEDNELFEKKAAAKTTKKNASKDIQSDGVEIISANKNESTSARSIFDEAKIDKLKEASSSILQELGLKDRIQDIFSNFSEAVNTSQIHSAEVKGARGTWQMENNTPHIYVNSLGEEFTSFHELIEIALEKSGIENSHSLSFILETELYKESMIQKLQSYNQELLSAIVKETQTELEGIYNHLKTGMDRERLNRKISNALLIALMAGSLIKDSQLKSETTDSLDSLMNFLYAKEKNNSFENITRTFDTINKKYLDFFQDQGFYSMNELANKHQTEMAA